MAWMGHGHWRGRQGGLWGCRAPGPGTWGEGRGRHLGCGPLAAVQGFSEPCACGLPSWNPDNFS